MDDKQQQPSPQEEQEFTLEDILKEFGSDPAQPDPEADETELPEEDTEIAQPGEQVQPEPAAEEDDSPLAEETEAPSEETDAPSEEMDAPAEPVTDATIRLDKIPAAVGKVRNAQHIDDEDEPILPPEQQEGTEPYSAEWEPDYEQPISEYIPPPPIPFPSRSRLRELKKKLVNGPEKMYYALSEQGSVKLRLAIFFNLLVLLLTAIGTFLFAFGVIGENRLKFMVFGQFFCMLLAALLGSNQLVEGVADLLGKRFSLNTMLVFTFILCCADGVMGLRQLRLPCCAAFSLQMTMSLWNTYHGRNTQLSQLDTMRKAIKLDSLSAVPDYHEGKKGILRDEGQVEDFMNTFNQPSKLEKVQSVYAIVALCLSVAAGIAAGVLHGISAGIQVAAVTTLAAIPASMHVVISRPTAVLERRLHSAGTVLCGWQGVEGLSGQIVFPIDHKDIFPVGTVKLNGVKFFGSRQPDEIIAYAAALIGSDNGMLAPLFAHLLDSRNGMHYEVQEQVVYEEGGIGGVVCGEAVLAGSLSFLKHLGVELPEGIRVNQAVCVAIDGELCGVFAISYEKDKTVAAGMTSLCGYRGLRGILLGGNFMLTAKLINNQYGVNTKRLLFVDPQTRAALEEKKPEPDAPVLALITGMGITPFVYALTGARTLKHAAKTGLTVHMIGGILGIVMMAVLAVFGATELLTPANMFLYQLVWMIPGLLITEWTRTI